MQTAKRHGPSRSHLRRRANVGDFGTINCCFNSIPSARAVTTVPSVAELKSNSMSARSPMDRTVVRKSSLQEQNDDGIIHHATPSERIEMVWQLTLDAWAFMDPTGAKSEFQRHVGRVERRES